MGRTHVPTGKPAPRPVLLRLKEVAAHLDVTLRTIHGWIAAGRLHVLRLSSRCVRVDPEELERFKRESQS
jgi:excisionase family DNA binding protein